MRKWFLKIQQNRYFLLFIMLFAYVQSIFIRVSAREEINAYTFTPEAALFSLFQASVLFLIMLFFIRKQQRIAGFSAKQMLKLFSSSLIVYLVAMKLIGLFIAIAFHTVERNFNRSVFFLNLFADLLNGFIYGSFFLAYYYYHKSTSHQLQLASYQQAISESRIYQLKTQLNPHFLFNNLNILDQLIEEDKDKASEFLNEFSGIYRYVLQASETKLISLYEELSFAEQYFSLVKHKYGEAYQLKIEGQNRHGYIVPLTLQLLIENAVQHSLGTEVHPVCITINVNQHIIISNNTNLKRNLKPTNGRALNNMREQYKLLTDEPVDIVQSDNSFSVTIPIIDAYS